jgi:hypothetical protein
VLCVTVFFLIGLGKWKIPQFVMPRTTPPEFRTMLPVVFAILLVQGGLEERRQRRRWRMRRDGLADFGEVAGADLEGVVSFSV